VYCTATNALKTFFYSSTTQTTQPTRSAHKYILHSACVAIPRLVIHRHTLPKPQPLGDPAHCAQLNKFFITASFTATFLTSFSATFMALPQRKKYTLKYEIFTSFFYFYFLRQIYTNIMRFLLCSVFTVACARALLLASPFSLSLMFLCPCFQLCFRCSCCCRSPHCWWSLFLLMSLTPDASCKGGQ
jgi:hypothetical protein